jgi:peptidoglycan L-alanyl-D-glutamate endopeptidase CwlK
MAKFGKRSKKNLSQCHPDIQTLFNEVIQFVDCSVICGHRGQREQNEAFNKGFSKVRFPNSNHNKIPSLAADVVPYPISWDNEQRFIDFGNFVLETSYRLWKEGKICHRIVWGGTWKWKDYPHFEIHQPK